MQIKDVVIKVIPHSEQHYETAGDWWFDADGTLQIRVSDVGNWRYHQLLAFHEYAEAILCTNQGISDQSVTSYDLEFEKMREAFPEIIADKEPGNSSTAPYQKQHQFASKVEFQLAKKLGVNWEEYGKIVNQLSLKNGN